MAFVGFESYLIWWFFIEVRLSSGFRKRAVARCCKHAFFGICSVCRSFFCHVRVRKCDSCCDNGTGWGGWYQASWSGVPASWGFEVVPFNTVLGFRQLQTASNCFKLLRTVSICFKLLRTALNCFNLLQTAGNCFKLLETAWICFKLLQTAWNWF